MHRKAATIRLSAALLGLLAIGACAAPPTKQSFADITFSHLPPFMFNVSRVEIVSEFKPSLKPPYVEQTFPIPPERALRRWAQDRIKAAGPQGSIKVIINDASVQDVELEHPKNLQARFTTEQSARYEAVADATIEIYGPRGSREAFANAHAERTQTVSEDATLNEREKIQYDLTEALMKDFNAQMEQNISTYLKRYLIAKRGAAAPP